MDYAEPRMLHASVLRAPVAAGTITRLDTAAASAMPGVHAVAVPDDTPSLSGTVVKDQRLLTGDVIRYMGEPIAAVAADTLEQAEAAVAVMALEVEPLAPVIDVEAAIAPGARLLHPGWQDYQVALPVVRDG